MLFMFDNALYHCGRNYHKGSLAGWIAEVVKVISVNNFKTMGEVSAYFNNDPDSPTENGYYFFPCEDIIGFCADQANLLPDGAVFVEEDDLLRLIENINSLLEDDDRYKAFAELDFKYGRLSLNPDPKGRFNINWAWVTNEEWHALSDAVLGNLSDVEASDIGWKQFEETAEDLWYIGAVSSRYVGSGYEDMKFDIEE